MSELVLIGESSWVSPWVFHAMVALEEKGLPYRLELVPLPIPEADKPRLRAKSVIGKVPILAHGDLWITESSVISEYLAERFPSSAGYPRLFPADLGERARARQVASAMRTSFMGLREDRPTTSVFGASVSTPLSARGAADAEELVRNAEAFIGKPASMFDAFCIADVDLALMLMRLVKNGDAVPARIASYANAVWSRPSVQTYLAHARRA